MSLPQTAEFVALKAAGYNDTQIAAMTRDEQVAHAQVRQNDKYREHAVAAGLKLEDLDSMSSADVFAAIYKSETSASRAQSYGVEKPELTAILENIGVELAGLADRPKQKFTEGGRATFDRATGRLTVAYMQQVIMRTIVGAFVSEVRDAHAVSDLRLYASWLKAWQELYPAIPAPAWMLNQALALEQHDYAGKRECRYPKPGDEADPRLTKPGKMTAMANRVSAKVIETMAVAAVKKCGHGLFDGLLRRVKPLNRNAGHAFAEEFSKCWAGFEMGETEAIRKQYARLAQGVATSLFERSMAGMVDLEPFAKEKEAQCALRIAARWDEWRQAYNDSGNWKTIGGSWELTTEIMKIEGQSWTIEKSFQNMIIMGDIGKGKTSCVAQPITSKLLRAGYGGMVPCVKSGERANFEKLAREAGRGNDLRFISQKHEWEKWGNNVLANMVQMFEDRDEFPNCEQPFEALNIILEFSGSKDINKSQGQNEIFQSTMRDLVRNAINLINLAGDGLNMLTIDDVLARRMKGSTDTEWYKKSYQAYLFEKAKWRMETFPHLSDNRDARKAMAGSRTYWGETIAAPEVPGSNSSFIPSCVQHFTSAASAMRNSGILQTLFAERTDYTADDMFEGDLIVCDLPILHEVEGGKAIGGFACGIMTADVMRRVQMRAGDTNHDRSMRPVATFCEEAQHVVTSHHPAFLSTARDKRHMMLMVTPGLSQIAKEFPGNAEVLMSALMQSFGTVITCQNADKVTKEFFIQTAGEYAHIDFSKGGESHSASFGEMGSRSRQVTDTVSDAGKKDVISPEDISHLNGCCGARPYAGALVLTGDRFSEPPRYPDQTRRTDMARQKNLGCRNVQFHNFWRPETAEKVAKLAYSLAPSPGIDEFCEAAYDSHIDEVDVPEIAELAMALDPAGLGDGVEGEVSTSGSRQSAPSTPQPAESRRVPVNSGPRLLHHHEIAQRNAVAENERCQAAQDAQHPLEALHERGLDALGKGMAAYKALSKITSLFSGLGDE